MTTQLDNSGIAGPDINNTGNQVTFPTNQGLGLREENGSAHAVTNSANLNFSLDRVDRNTDTEESVDRDIDRQSDALTKQLLDSDAEKLRECITQLQGPLCDIMFTSKEELIEQADKAVSYTHLTLPTICSV